VSDEGHRESLAAGIRRQESQLPLRDQNFRYRRAWRPAEPTRVMVLVHGYAEHCGRYDEMAMHFAARGFSVHAYDQAGHGRTGGPRGHVDRYDRLLDDLVCFIDWVREQESGLPITLVGHSMGGLVAAATAVFREPTVDHIVLSGAALDVGEGLPWWRRLMAKAMVPLGGRVGMSIGLDASGLSRDPDVIRRYEADPLVEDRMSPGFALGMMSTVEATSRAADRIDRPVFLLHGEADPICPSAGSERFFGGLEEPVRAHSALKLYPELRHEIFNEPERHDVWRDVLEWIEAAPLRSPSQPEERSGPELQGVGAA